MDQDFISSIKKFMETMGMEYFMDIHRQGYDRFVCIEVKVMRDGEIEYHQYHCYKMSGDGVKYAEGNMVKGVNEGILAYLGDDRNVDRYFEKRARQMASKYFNDLDLQYEL